jgi:hypothetical protein
VADWRAGVSTKVVMLFSKVFGNDVH